jgi:ATP-binding cassette subfamily F protein 3
LFEQIHSIEYSLLEIETALEESPEPQEMDRLLQRQAELLEAMQHLGGWNYANQIDTALTRLGFSASDRKRPIEQLSGGWRNRAALAHLLLQAPEVLLLDEPTNFLDIAGLTWLEEFLLAYKGALLLVSHDRHFLERVVNRIVEVENFHLHEYPGSYSAYVKEKPLRLKGLERQFQHEAELLAFEAEAISERKEIARNPSQVLKRKLSNIKKQVEPRPVDKIVTAIYDGLKVSKDLCLVEGLSKSYASQLLFKDLNFEIHRGDRIAVLGPNGCGKTTLLRLMVQEDDLPQELSAFDHGRVGWAKGSAYIYYNEIFENLEESDSVSHAVNVTGLAYHAPRKKVNAFLGLLQFSELDLNQKISTLSGGQKARVALAKCLLSGANVILLDEPTNHLDLTSTQVMERALVNFPGAVVVISHDRFFIDKVATRLLVFEGSGKVRLFEGNWTMYAGL